MNRSRINLADLIVQEFGTTGAEARRLIMQRGVRIDNRIVPPAVIDVDRDMLEGAVIQIGRNRFRLILR